MSNAELFQKVCKFLEENKLTATLQTFKREFERETGRKPQRLRKNNLADIQKIRFDRTNPLEVTEVREVLQKTDDRILNRLVHKVYKASKLEDTTSRDTHNRLQGMKFYRRLVSKEAEKSRMTRHKRQQNDISQIKSEQANDLSIISRPEEVLDIFVNEVDEYEGERDIGYDIYEFPEQDLKAACKEIAMKKGYPQSALAPNTSRYPTEYYKEKEAPSHKQGADISQHILLPKTIKFPPSQDQLYPIEFNGVIFDSFNLKIVFDQNKTGFEDHKDYQIVINDVIAGRYQIVAVLGQAQFSKAVKVLNLENGQFYCMKIISNNKDYVDQSIDEIKLLKYINYNGNVDEKCVLRFFDYFYHKQHLIIVTQLLKDNLYEAYKMNMRSQQPKYFTLHRVQKVARQIMTALDYIHSLHIIHSDLKPENILIKSYSNCLIKVIDFGSSIFFHDNLSFYLQTRSYRAPEVIIGLKYDEKIDIWSAGCILAELFTGRVLFENETVAGLLARMQGIVGPWPQWMINHGQLSHKFFSKNLVLFEQVYEQNEDYGHHEADKKPTGYCRAIVPKKSNLRARLKTKDEYFVDFIRKCLRIDPSQRVSAREALQHPFISEAQYDDTQ